MVHDGLKLRLAGAQGGIDLVAFCHRVRMRAARCGDPEPCDREHEPHADGDPSTMPSSVRQEARASHLAIETATSADERESCAKR